MRSRKEEPVWLAQWARPLGIGTAVGALACLLSLLLMAALLLTQDVPQNGVTPLALVSLVAGSFVGGAVAARCAGKNGWLMGLLCGGTLFVLLLITGGFALLHSSNAAQAWLKLGMMAVAAATGGIVGINLRRKR